MSTCGVRNILTWRDLGRRRLLLVCRLFVLLRQLLLNLLFLCKGFICKAIVNDESRLINVHMMFRWHLRRLLLLLIEILLSIWGNWNLGSTVICSLCYWVICRALFTWIRSLFYIFVSVSHLLVVVLLACAQFLILIQQSSLKLIVSLAILIIRDHSFLMWSSILIRLFTGRLLLLLLMLCCGILHLIMAVKWLILILWIRSLSKSIWLRLILS